MCMAAVHVAVKSLSGNSGAQMSLEAVPLLLRPGSGKADLL